MMEFGEHVLVTVRCRECLNVIDDGPCRVFGAAVSPFTPIARDITSSRKRVAHENIVSAHGLLRVIRVIAICESVSLMEAGLLRRTSR